MRDALPRWGFFFGRLGLFFLSNPAPTLPPLGAPGIGLQGGSDTLPVLYMPYTVSNIYPDTDETIYEPIKQEKKVKIMIFMNGQTIDSNELDLTEKLNGAISLQGHREIRLGNYDLGATSAIAHADYLSPELIMIETSIFDHDGRLIARGMESVDITKYDWVATLHEEIVEDAYDEDE